MLNFNFALVIICVNIALIAAAVDQCNTITIEGGEMALKKIFHDFDEIKTAVNDLKIKNKACHNNKNLGIFDARFDSMPENCYQTALPRDCAAATQCTQRSGIYKIQVGKFCNEPFYVACDDVTENGDWLVIQKRQDGSENFYRDWTEYENGFGDLEGEFFIGLKKLYALTNFNGPQELLVIMEDTNYTRAYAKYDSFAIADESESYNLKRIGKYSGNAGDSLQTHVGMKFTTKDRDNDLQTEYNCAVTFTGAWWYKTCHHSNPNGIYADNTFGKGINWYHFRGHTLSLPSIKMMIRRSRVV